MSSTDGAGYAREPDRRRQEANQIWCIHPPDRRYEKKIVFYLGADSNRVPKPIPSRAVLHPHHREHRDGTLLFLAVARAAREHYHSRNAQADEREVYRPSPYLEEAAGRSAAPST